MGDLDARLCTRLVGPPVKYYDDAFLFERAEKVSGFGRLVLPVPIFLSYALTMVWIFCLLAPFYLIPLLTGTLILAC